MFCSVKLRSQIKLFMFHAMRQKKFPFHFINNRIKNNLFNLFNKLVIVITYKIFFGFI